MSAQDPEYQELLRKVAEYEAKIKAQSQPLPVQSIGSSSSMPKTESSSTKPTLETMFENNLSSLIGHWNRVSCDESRDAEENEIAPDVPTYILGSANKADLERRFPYHVVRSSSPPPPITAHAAGMHEQNLRHAIRFKVEGLLDTTSEEPKWTVDTALPFFGGWEVLVPYTLGESKD